MQLQRVKRERMSQRIVLSPEQSSIDLDDFAPEALACIDHLVRAGYSLHARRGAYRVSGYGMTFPTRRTAHHAWTDAILDYTNRLRRAFGL